jgi:hypothetical protein
MLESIGRNSLRHPMTRRQLHLNALVSLRAAAGEEPSTDYEEIARRLKELLSRAWRTA